MSTKEKLKQRILAIPVDLKYTEMKAFLNSIGYKESNKGNTSGSRVSFISENDTITFHKPHGSQPVKRITIKQIITELEMKNKI